MDRAVEFSKIIAGVAHAPVVYFIRVGDRVKIGTTTNLKNRVNGLTFTLSDVTHLVPGGAEVERAMHDRWSQYRIHDRREWFYVRGELAKYLAPAVRPAPVVSARESDVAVQHDPNRVSLAEASRRGVIPMKADALRQAKRRDPSFPEGVYGMFAVEELQEWYRLRLARRTA